MLSLQPIAAFDDNYFWLAADAAGNALVVDPGEAAPVEAALAAQGLTLTTILITHHHADHIGGVDALAARHRPAIYAPDDPRIPTATQRVGDGDRVLLDAPAARFDVIAVPGHTTSHIAYAGAGVLFCGDTIFSVGCGRLFEGTPAQMLASLDRLAALPGTSVVCCAHEYTAGNCAWAATIEPRNPALAARIEAVRTLRAAGRPTVPTTLDAERATNPFLRVDAPDVVAWGRARGIEPADRVARFAALRAGKDEFRAAAR